MPKLLSFSGSKFPPFQYVILGKGGVSNLGISRVRGGGGEGNSNLGFRNQISRGVESLNLVYQRGGGGINLIYPGFGSMD